MKTVSGKRFAKVLEEHRWTLARITKHHIYKKPVGEKPNGWPRSSQDKATEGTN